MHGCLKALDTEYVASLCLLHEPPGYSFHKQNSQAPLGWAAPAVFNYAESCWDICACRVLNDTSYLRYI